MVSRKTEYKTLDGTPRKRVFQSIINDYDLKTGLCELIDNAIDLWQAGDSIRQFSIDVTLNVARQMISVKDNAGGVKEEDFENLISPGATGHDLQRDTIGVFGVGGKRAGVALGELVEIKSRYKSKLSLQLDITKEWLDSIDWEITSYKIPNISPNSTYVEISKLRRSFDAADVDLLQEQLGEIYHWFIDKGCELKLNGSNIEPRVFDTWAYPPSYPPKNIIFEVSPVEEETLTVSITAGLIRDREPEKENYGTYFYCNNRLIVKEVRTRDVGYYVTNEAGVPHPDASLCRVIIKIQGKPHLMPWNSSKSDLNYSHPAFLALRPPLIDLVSYFTKLSRRTKDDWDRQITQFETGEISSVQDTEIKSSGKIVLPDLPAGNVRRSPYVSKLKTSNKRLLEEQPWTLGLIETMGIIHNIEGQKLDTKNRAVLILLDSNLEIAMKEFIVNRKALFPTRNYPDSRIRGIFNSRTTVINEVSAHINFSATLLTKIDHYYGLRNKLIHERATVGITDGQVADYRKVVQKVLKLLFDVKFPRPD